MTRDEAIRKIYRSMRKYGAGALTVAATLYTLGVTVDELEPVVREYGDLPEVKKEG